MHEVKSDGFFSPHAIRSIPWLVLGKALAFVVYLSISILLVRSLTPHEYGEYSLCRSIAEYFVKIGALGLNFAMLRFIPELMNAQNLAGMRRLLTRTALLQVMFLIFLTGVLYSAHNQVTVWLKIDVQHYALFIMFMALAATLKNFGNDVSTALYQAKFLTVVSFFHSVLWLSFLTVFFYFGLGVEGVLLATALAGTIVGGWNILRLIIFFRNLSWRSPLSGIGKKRVLNLAFPMLLNDLVNLMITNYTEIFFLGLFFTPTLVSYYDVGYQLPFIVLTFIPFALQTLFASAFAEAYSKDKDCLPNLVYGHFQILATLTVPMACFGALFAKPLILLVYGAKMLPAVPVVTVFSIFHMVGQFSIPPSMAINATEKTMKTVWFGVLELVLAVGVDFILIKQFGLMGAVSAVVVCFALTLPIRIWLIRRLVGGIYFPGSFFIRLVVLCLAAGLVAWAVMVGLAAYPLWLQLLACLLVYIIFILAGVRIGKVVNHSDVERFKSLNIPTLDRALDIVLGQQP